VGFEPQTTLILLEAASLACGQQLHVVLLGSYSNNKELSQVQRFRSGVSEK
jgi:hypothetical protein